MTGLSTKYKTVVKYLGCKVVVFMNQQPDYNKLSQDRYDIITIPNEPLLIKPYN